MKLVKIITVAALAGTLSFAAVAETVQPAAAGNKAVEKSATPSGPQSGNMPMNVGQKPIYMGQMPMGAGQRPFAVGQMPMNRGQRPMGAGQMPMNRNQRPMGSGQMPMNRGQTPMMGRGQGNRMGRGKMGHMNPQMKQQMMARKQAHMKKMENHLANIEALLRELVEMQKKR